MTDHPLATADAAHRHRTFAAFAALALMVTLSVLAVAIPAPVWAQEATTTPQRLDQYVGRYEIARGVELAITRTGDQLSAQLTGQGIAAIYPTGDHEFAYKVVDARLTFRTDDDGQVNAVVLRQAGREIVGRKVDSDATPPEAGFGHREAPVDPAMFDRYVGVYRLGPTVTATITRKDAQLFVQITGQPALPVFPESEHEFFYKAVDAQITFETAAEALATAIVIHQGGQDLRAERVEDSAGTGIEPAEPDLPDGDTPSTPGIHQLALPDGRLYTLRVPDGYTGRQPVPLVVVLHQGYPGGPTPFWGRQLIESVVEPGLDALGAIVAAPDLVTPGWANPEAERHIVTLLDHLEAHYAIDQSRTLLTGYSAGGIGTWYLAPRLAERFRAALVMAGHPQADSADLAWPIPLYVIHSTADELVPLAPTRQAVEQMRARGLSVELAIVNGTTHLQWARFPPYLQAALEWIRAAWNR